MPTTYDLLLAVHVLAAAVWVGGAIVLQVLELRAGRAGAGAAVAHLRDAEFIGTRVFIPASLVVLGAGIALVVDGGWSLEPWIVFALAVWALSFLTGALFLGPRSAEILRLTTTERIDSAAITSRLRRLHLVSRIEDYLLVLVVLDMVLKPGT